MLTQKQALEWALSCPFFLEWFDWTRHSEGENVTQFRLSWNEVQAAVPLIVYCTTALTSISDSVSYVTFFIFGMAYHCSLFPEIMHCYHWLVFYIIVLKFQSLKELPWLLSRMGISLVIWRNRVRVPGYFTLHEIISTFRIQILQPKSQTLTRMWDLSNLWIPGSLKSLNIGKSLTSHCLFTVVSHYANEDTNFATPNWIRYTKRVIKVIPGNDQNSIPTNQGTAGSKLKRTG